MSRRVQLGSLDPQRDLTYVSDTAAGLMALGACDAAIGKAVNLGSGSALSVGELVRKCQKITRREIPVVVDSARVRPADSEVRCLVSDNRMARSLTGWEPSVSVDEGLQRCNDFIRDYPQPIYRSAPISRRFPSRWACLSWTKTTTPSASVRSRSLRFRAAWVFTPSTPG
jgi:dTDP-D-glucose 4,6-dehydratase